jgi:hypothetical protein
MSLAARDRRAKAVQCDEHVASANRFEVKVQHRELARQWRSMAERLERMAGLRGAVPVGWLGLERLRLVAVGTRRALSAAEMAATTLRRPP